MIKNFETILLKETISLSFCKTASISQYSEHASTATFQ